jgi:hypothetical protein
MLKFVLCTSTLAQGVNLPIRYLIISGTMQGVERIKARDFRNLVGCSGRAGMHTEGTIWLEPPESATTVVLRDGKRLVQDGPYAYTKADACNADSRFRSCEPLAIAEGRTRKEARFTVGEEEPPTAPLRFVR